MMASANGSWAANAMKDFTAGAVVFLVALPLCLGVALASNAPLFSGLLAGIIGGIVVGMLSGSQTSVSGPAAGLTAIVTIQIATLGSYQAFLLAVVIAGAMQVFLGMIRAGFIAAFFPTSVIKGLLAAIGCILILKQIPHLVGHDPDPEGEMSFIQPDQQNTFSELIAVVDDVQLGAAIVGLTSLAILFVWDRVPRLKKSRLPAPLVVVLYGTGLSLLFQRFGGQLVIESSHLVQVPTPENLAGLLSFIQIPDFSQWMNRSIYFSGFTIAAVASLETLLNLEAVDKLDHEQRMSPPSRELFAQGVGNIIAGMVGGIPVTSVIVRSSVNINAGGKTKLATIVHGLLLLISVALFPTYLNMIPHACLAAILFHTGVKLASPTLVKQMWSEGRYQFIPFMLTVLLIVLTDLLIGVILGLVISLTFILRSNMRRPMRRIVEKHLGGEVIRIELANQVSFLNRAALERVLNEIPRGGQVLLDARNTDYIDPDVLDLIRDFVDQKGPAHSVSVSLLGFRNRYQLQDQTQYVDYSTRELQSAVTSEQVLQILKDGHKRFLTGQRLTRDFGRLVNATAEGQHPLAVVLSCIDSRTPAELIFDLGMGDIFSVRVAGNITSRKVLGSVEYGCAVAGAKLILVMGHTRCGAVTAAVRLFRSPKPASHTTGCQHIDPIVEEIQQSIDPTTTPAYDQLPLDQREQLADATARRNVIRIVDLLPRQSDTIKQLVDEGRIQIVGAMYDVVTGDIEFIDRQG
jgi:carbonic anhydrase/SulP family sulfate permease